MLMLMLMFRDDVDYQVGAADDRTRCKLQILRMHQEEITTAGIEDMRKKVVGIAGIEAEVDLTRL